MKTTEDPTSSVNEIAVEEHPRREALPSHRMYEALDEEKTKKSSIPTNNPGHYTYAYDEAKLKET